MLKSLTQQFAEAFARKDAASIGDLLAPHFALFDPALKWVKGKETVLEVLKKQFLSTNKVAYEVINVYQEGNTSILEFKITLDELILHGVDFIEWENNKMTELRCYYNPPNHQP